MPLPHSVLEGNGTLRRDGAGIDRQGAPASERTPLRGPPQPLAGRACIAGIELNVAFDVPLYSQDRLMKAEGATTTSIRNPHAE